MRVGFVTIWFERGQAYVTHILRDVIAREHETFVFARTGGVYNMPKLETTGYWAVPNLTTYEHYGINGATLIDWIYENRLNAVIFNEEYDWNLVRDAKTTGVKVLTYLDYYKTDWMPNMHLYDAVLCSTRRSYNLVKGFCNAHYVAWGIDTELFSPRDNGEPKATFFHNAGWLGIGMRKGTPAVIQAFAKVSEDLPDASLYVHAQINLMTPDEIPIIQNHPRIEYHIETVPAPGLYQKGRILLFPSKLEGLGLPLLEGMACGLPAIATDAPPMNEFVIDGYNGYLVKVKRTQTRGDNIAFQETIVDVDDLVEKMLLLARDKWALYVYSKYARIHIEEKFTLDRLASRVNPILEAL